MAQRSLFLAASLSFAAAAPTPAAERQNLADAARNRLVHASSWHGVTEADFGGKWFQARDLGARRIKR